MVLHLCITSLIIFSFISAAVQSVFPEQTDKEVEDVVSRWLTTAKDPRKGKIIERQELILLRRIKEAKKALRKQSESEKE